MKAETFQAWRKRLGLTKVAAAKALGISRPTVDGYEAGWNKIPLHIALACAAIAHGLPALV
jgi:DNA-binding XRE family transcriptional regulator